MNYAERRSHRGFDQEADALDYSQEVKSSEGILDRGEIIDLLVSDLSKFNEWRITHAEESVDLRDAVLDGLRLDGAMLFKADMQASVLRGTSLREANLMGANLSLADLAGADLTGVHAELADFTAANLHHVSMRDSQLMLAVFKGANREGLDITGANFRIPGQGTT